MSTYSVYTWAPIIVTIDTEGEDGPEVIRVQVDEDRIPATFETALERGNVFDDNGLTVKPSYSDSGADPDWPLIKQAFEGPNWPVWEGVDAS